MDEQRQKNFNILIAVSILLGMAGAIYEVSLPLFLKRSGLNWTKIGWIYTLSALATFVVRTGFGTLSDKIGRKVIYVWSLMVTGIATLFTPVSNALSVQIVLKSIVEPSSRVREAMHSVMLYECWPDKFRKVLSRTRGYEFLFHFAGLLVISWLIAKLTMTGLNTPHGGFIMVSGIIFIIAGVILQVSFFEDKERFSGKVSLKWSDLIRADLPKPLWIITISIFIFNAAVVISHCFVLQLFFQEKYGASDSDIFMIGALHRLVPGITLLFLGHHFRKRLRTWLMVFLISEGVFIAAPSFIPAGNISFGGFIVPLLWVSVLIWLFHDLLGMGLWLPMQQELMQKYSREYRRGEDISLATALGAMGGVPAPFIAGWLRELPGVSPLIALNIPFFVSGIGVALSALVLFALPPDSDK